jgi:hypothetical protein
MMKKHLCIALCILFLFSLCACKETTSELQSQSEPSNTYTLEDDTSAVSETKNKDSAIYSEEEIASAIEVIVKEFEAEWIGCTLTEIYYAGDWTSQKYQDWADRNGADEVIVLMSSFDTDSSADISLNPNHTYKNWNWILVRKIGGEWQHVDHGY